VAGPGLTPAPSALYLLDEPCLFRLFDYLREVRV